MGFQLIIAMSSEAGMSNEHEFSVVSTASDANRQTNVFEYQMSFDVCNCVQESQPLIENRNKSISAQHEVDSATFFEESMTLLVSLIAMSTFAILVGICVWKLSSLFMPLFTDSSPVEILIELSKEQ